MKTSSLVALAVAFPLLGAPAVQAAPVSRPVQLAFEFDHVGVGSFVYYSPSGAITGFCSTCYLELSLQASATISVDSAAGTLRLDPGVLQLSSPVSRYPTSTTGIGRVRIEQLTNLTGTFAVGGAAGLGGEPPCSLAATGACVAQTGFGGVMPLSGTYFISPVPNLVVIPVNLNVAGFGQGGTATAGDGNFFFDGGPWTVGPARVSFAGSTSASSLVSTRTGFVGTDAFRLVAPAYVNALGNQMAIWSTLTVTFNDGLGVPGFVSATVPEPAVWLLVAATAGYAAMRLGRRR